MMYDGPILVSMSPEEARRAREDYIKTILFPGLANIFFEEKASPSATLFVAQYWDDEADDAVHGLIIPDTADGKFGSWDDAHYPSSLGISGPLNQSTIGGYGYNHDAWDDNNTSVTLWAVWAPENGSQDYDYNENYGPAVTIKRDGSFVFHPQVRPALDGVMSSRDKRSKVWTLKKEGGR